MYRCWRQADIPTRATCAPRLSASLLAADSALVPEPAVAETDERAQAAGSGAAARGCATRIARGRVRVPHEVAARERSGVEFSEQLDIIPPGVRDPPGAPHGVVQRERAGLDRHVEVPRRPDAASGGSVTGVRRRDELQVLKKPGRSAQAKSYVWGERPATPPTPLTR